MKTFRMIFVVTAALLASAAFANQPKMPQIKLPPGFHIELFFEIPGARSLSLGGKGVVYVSAPREGKVYALRNGERISIIEGLNAPNGIAFHDGDLYVAEIDRVLKFANIERDLSRPPMPQVIRADLPKETHHGARYIGFGPDNKLYIAIGVPCNICEPETFKRGGATLEYASITRMNADGSQWEMYARGVRNSVGFDWQPGTGELWFTDNGRDLLGDDLPADELNRAPKSGLHFGYPYCHAGDLADPQLGKTTSCAQGTPPAAKLGAHVAALGMRFYTGKMFPAAYRNQIFVAKHGSWNRSRKSGYSLNLIRFKDGKLVSDEPFASGWLYGNEQVSGRPVDLLVMPDGALLVSDDHAGRVYRIYYKP